MISRENARRMIDTSDMLRKDRMDAYQDGRLSVYMEDVVRRLERLQKNKSEEEQTSKLFTCLLYTSPSPRDRQKSRMPSSA